MKSDKGEERRRMIKKDMGKRWKRTIYINLHYRITKL